MEVKTVNKARLRFKLERLLPANEVEFVYKSIISSKHFDTLVDVYVVDGKIRCLTTDLSPRENLKRAALNYFDSKLPTEVTTYTQLDNLAKAVKRDYDLIAMEALSDIIKDLEE